MVVINPSREQRGVVLDNKICPNCILLINVM